MTPSIIVILIVAAFLRSFRENPWVERAFYGLRPASTGLIGAACVSVFLEVLTDIRIAGDGFVNRVSVSGENLLLWPQLFLAALLLVLTNAVPRVKDLHPIVFIALAAVIGIAFRFAGA